MCSKMIVVKRISELIKCGTNYRQGCVDHVLD